MVSCRADQLMSGGAPLVFDDMNGVVYRISYGVMGSQ